MLNRNIIKAETPQLADLLRGTATAERDRWVADLAGVELSELLQETGSIAVLADGGVLSWGDLHRVGRYRCEGERWVHDLIATAPDGAVTVFSRAQDANGMRDMMWEDPMNPRIEEREELVRDGSGAGRPRD